LAERSSGDQQQPKNCPAESKYKILKMLSPVVRIADAIVAEMAVWPRFRVEVGGELAHLEERKPAKFAAKPEPESGELVETGGKHDDCDLGDGPEVRLSDGHRFGLKYGFGWRKCWE
jgi:hypothetical protein